MKRWIVYLLPLLLCACQGIFEEAVRITNHSPLIYVT